MSELPEPNPDYVGDILDEIALEGLDGITVEALWKRLSVRPRFCFKIDDKSKIFIWDIITRLNDVEFYEIPKPRPQLQIYDYLSPDCDHEKAISELDELYPYHSIKNAPGIYGSCQDFLSRMDITYKIINMSLEEVEVLYGTKLAIVAGQDARYISLMGKMCPPSLNFAVSSVPYEMLERIGRTRHCGISTNGKASLQTIVEDPKSIFHYLRPLMTHKFIKKQSLFGSLQSNPHASKVYLMRFYGEQANEYQLILQTAIEELKTRPNGLMPYEDFYMLFDTERRIRVKKYAKTNAFRKYISVSKMVPYRVIYPNASQSEWEKKSKNGEKMIRCLQLIDMNMDIADIFDKDDEPEDDEEESSGTTTNSILYANQPVLLQAFNHLKNSGSHGLTQRDLCNKMGLDKYHARAIIKRLTKEKYITYYTEHEGRKHISRYIVEKNKQNVEAVKEIAQILSTPTKNKNAVNDEATPMAEVQEIEKITIQDEKTSYRSLKRIGLILKLIKTHRYRVFHQITNYIMDEEIKEGLTTKIDRRTLKRILDKLVKDGLIKSIVLTDDIKGPEHVMKLYTDPSFVVDETSAKAFFHKQSADTSVVTTPITDEGINFEIEFSAALVENHAGMRSLLKHIPANPDSSSSKSSSGSSYSPKFVRLHMIHDLMFYLIYEYTGEADKSQEELIEELSKKTLIDDDLKRELPRLYGSQLHNYTFIPPLKVNKEKVPGWCLMSDIILRIPLTLFVKTLRVGCNSRELSEYLHHPIKKYYLVKDLPSSVKNTLFGTKMPFNAFYSDIRRLCYIGLLQYGQKCGKGHYQTLLYLNRKASLLDTTSLTAEYYQLPANEEFPKKEYEFKTKEDVKNFWIDMFNICVRTNLGVKECMVGKEILSEREMQKESLKKYAEPVSHEKAIENDKGILPGDHLGAAGLDSVMFSFLKSNWIQSVKKTKEQIKLRNPVKIPLQRIIKDLPIKKKYFPRQKSLRKKVVNKPKIIEERLFIPEGRSFGRLRKVKKRETKYKPKKKVQYDELDVEAMKLMRTLRVTWSQAEDNFLLICKVAMMYQCPKQKSFVRIPNFEVRKALRENVPESMNKTQKAIGRRIVYMLKNPTTVKSVNLCLEELKQIPDIASKFGCEDLVEKIKPSAPNLQELQNELYKRFHALVLFIKERFIDGSRIVSIQGADKSLIPDSINEFKRRFAMEESGSLGLDIKRIREDVIRATLMSSFSCKADKTSSAVQLFEIYRQYEDDELQNAIRKLHGDGVITISKKANNNHFKTPKYLPLSYSPYQLSFAFQNLLNKKYSNAIYAESFSNIYEVSKLANDENFEINLNDCNVALFLLCSDGLLTLELSVPDQIIVLDWAYSDDDKYSKMLERYSEMLKGNTVEKNIEDGESSKRSLSECEVSSAKRIKLESGSEVTQEKAVEVEQINFDKSTNQSSRIVLYMIREEAKEMNNDPGKLSQDFFVVNASKVYCKKKGEEFSWYLKKMEQKYVNLIIDKIQSRASVPLTLINENMIYEEFLQKGYSTIDLEELQKTLDFIYSKKELGVTNGELCQNCKSLILPEIVKFLISSKIVIKSGIEETIYVGQKYCTPWLVNSFKLTRLEREKIKPTDITAVDMGDEHEAPASKKKRKGIITIEDLKSDDYTPPSCSMDFSNKVKIVMRPWIRVDGSVNKRILERFLEMILGFLNLNPGISLQAVMDKFVPDITPVWTKDLVEILYEIGCLNLRTHVVTKKASLFSNACIEISDVYTGLEEDKNVAIEAKVNSIATLGLFIKNLYSKNFTKDNT